MGVTTGGVSHILGKKRNPELQLSNKDTHDFYFSLMSVQSEELLDLISVKIKNSLLSLYYQLLQRSWDVESSIGKVLTNACGH